jgi:hypothetical protein
MMHVYGVVYAVSMQNKLQIMIQHNECIFGGHLIARQ